MLAIIYSIIIGMVMASNLNVDVVGFINKAKLDFDSISEERKEILSKLSDYIKTKSDKGEEINLTFICTHNSRRSHMSQIWAQTAAEYYGVKNVFTYSGGTEATAFNPRAVKALKKAGFSIEKTGEAKNPVYLVSYDDHHKEPLKCFSKKYSDEFNPQENFIAVMTCTDADEACPVVFGAEARFSIPFEDPKKFDGTDKEEMMYDQRCKQIATELLYVFSSVK